MKYLQKKVFYKERFILACGFRGSDQGTISSDGLFFFFFCGTGV
jgi:hypothetical protein